MKAVMRWWPKWFGASRTQRRAASGRDEVPLEKTKAPKAAAPEARPFESGSEPEFDPEAAVELPIDGTLDLHHFRPKDLRTLVPDYLQACQARGILEVRVVHGKGKGQLRRSVHALLERDPIVRAYRLCPPERGGWGATLVDLQAVAKDPSPSTTTTTPTTPED